jgi:signal transduction histidine kinase/DNA-binding response OmpR family regulator/PAS domain-containing protein
MYYSAIGLLAALVLCIVNWDILRNSVSYQKHAWVVYRKFLFAVLAYFVTDILWGFLESQKLSTALFIDTTVYFMALAFGLSFWAEYTVAFLNEKNTFARVLVSTGRVIVALILGMAVINVFKPVLFTIDDACVYKTLPVRHILLVFQILFLIMISLYAFTCKMQADIPSKKSARFRILAAFGMIMAACLIIQIWFPYLPLYSIGYMLGTCLLHAFVANDEKEDYKRQLEEAGKIAELKERFRALLDNMPGMTFTKDAETGKYLACNQAFAEYAHKETPEGVVGLTDAQIFDPETAAHFVHDDKIALSLSKPYIFYEDVPDAEGNPRQLQTTKIRYKDTAGRSCVLGMCQDITDLVSIQHEQSMTKEAYEGAVKTGLMYNHIAQTLARDYTEMFYVNKDTEEFTEYRRSEKDGTFAEVRRGWHFFSDCKTELSESVYPDDKAAFLAAINRKQLMKALSRKDTFVMSFRRMIRSKPVYVSMKASRMEMDEQYIIIGFMDVDAEMREAMAKNEALSEALSTAEAAAHARTTFLAGMSHEIRTPINAIIGLDTLALKHPDLDTKTREYFEKIGNSARQLLSLINEILEMSRMESGRESLLKTEFSLGAMLEQIHAQMQSQCREKGIQYVCRAEQTEEYPLIGDDRKLKKALLRILSHAVRCTGEGGSITMTVEKVTEYEDQVSLRFCIRDTGGGMDAEQLSRVFDAFPQENAGGSGLDMAITKRIVEMMNGSVTAESEKGTGTAITVTVTLHKGERMESAYTGEIDLHVLSILVVDDDPIEAEHAGMVLEEAGIRVDICTSGQEALRKLEVQHIRKQPYSLILMDWNMPEMNGRDTSAEIRRLYEGESIIVAMTAYSWDDIREEAHEVGVDSYLEKPLFAANIIEDLVRIAQQSHLAVFKEKKKARLSGRRILLAEDVEINAEILTDMLDMENIKVDHAANGKIAVELFEQSTAGIYSAILMDVRMPEMDGLEAARVIRSLNREDAKRIPIIALTANAFDEDVQLSMQAGMNAHLNKPVEADRLLRTLGELIYESEEKLTMRMD